MGKPTWEVPGNRMEWVMVDGSCKIIHRQSKSGLKLYSGHVRGKWKTVTKEEKKRKSSWYIGGILYDAQVVLKPLVPGLFSQHASWLFCITWKQVQNNMSKVLEHLVFCEHRPRLTECRVTYKFVYKLSSCTSYCNYMSSEHSVILPWPNFSYWTYFCCIGAR